MMKQAAPFLVCLMLAACGGPAYYQGPRYYPPPPPPPPREANTHPYAPPPELRQPPAEAREQPREPAAIHAPANVPSAGPLKTAAIGGYMDDQEKDLRQHLRGMAGVGRPGDDIVLNLRDDQLFEGNSNRLSSSGAAALTRIGVVLRHYDHTQIEVGGYSDTSGTPEQNKATSEARAHAVCEALEKTGVTRGRLTCEGFGQQRLRIATGDHKSEPRNRRIEIMIMPKASG
jgi:outer membrane protein OmpA-like peptidoglycan-associated protein